MNSVTVKIDNEEFDVTLNGTVYQPRSVSPVTLDEVRIAASDRYLRERDLTPVQRRYWVAVSSVSPPDKRLPLRPTERRR